MAVQASGELMQRVDQRMRARAWSIIMEGYRIVLGAIVASIVPVLIFTKHFHDADCSIQAIVIGYSVISLYILACFTYAIWLSWVRIKRGPRAVISRVSNSVLARHRQHVVQNRIVQQLLEGQITGRELSRFVSKRQSTQPSLASLADLSNSTIDEVAYNCYWYIHRPWLTRSEMKSLVPVLSLLLILALVITMVTEVTATGTPPEFDHWWNIAINITWIGGITVAAISVPFYEHRAAPYELAFYDELAETVAQHDERGATTS